MGTTATSAAQSPELFWRGQGKGSSSEGLVLVVGIGHKAVSANLSSGASPLMVTNSQTLLCCIYIVRLKELFSEYFFLLSWWSPFVCTHYDYEELYKPLCSKGTCVMEISSILHSLSTGTLVLSRSQLCMGWRTLTHWAIDLLALEIFHVSIRK